MRITVLCQPTNPGKFILIIRSHLFLLDSQFTGGYVHSLEGSDKVFSDGMKKAITYAVNQEQNLRRFLTDGNIPCDNGYVERIIRSYSVSRANWLFADTIHGEKVNAPCIL